MTFAYFKPFLGLKYTANPGQLKTFFVLLFCTNEHRLCLQGFTEVSHLHGRFEFRAVGDKWQHKTEEEEEEYKKTRKQALTRQ